MHVFARALELYIIVILFDFSEEDVGTYDKNKNNKYPWIGVLRVKIDMKEAVTGLILIKERMAIANALELGSHDRSLFSKSSEAMFFDSEDKPHFFLVETFKIHPEYENNVFNTIALLKLSEEKDFKWTPIQWPDNFVDSRNLYTVGYTDREYEAVCFNKVPVGIGAGKKVFEQVIHQMTSIPREDCEMFYINEDLNFKTMWPSHCKCCIETYNRHNCVYDAGMALVTKRTGTWTLIGISILGPGCSLPSRYIDFAPYIPWILAESAHMTRRSGGGKPQVDLRNETYADLNLDKDIYILNQIDNDTIVLRPALENMETPELLNEPCDNTTGKLMYREYGKIDASDMSATAIISLSLYDLSLPRPNCIEINVICDKRSETEFWIHKGFGQFEINKFIKKTALPIRGMPKEKRIWYLDDQFKSFYDATNITSIFFKFQFEGTAKVEIYVFGSPAEQTTTSTSTTTRGTSSVAPPQWVTPKPYVPTTTASSTG